MNAHCAVLNEGISGARVLTDHMGVNALARFDEDVLSHPRADTVILMMGINDIGWPDSVLEPRVPAPSAEQIIGGYEQLIARAHAHEMRIIGATLTPFGVAFKGTPLEGFYNAEVFEWYPGASLEVLQRIRSVFRPGVAVSH